MKRFDLFFSLCGLCLLAVPGCKEDSAATNRGFFGEPFTIRANEPILVTSASTMNKPDCSLIVEFRRVVYDSRCPLTSCSHCYGSSAEVELLVTRQTGSRSVFLWIPGCQEEFSCDRISTYQKDTIGYRFCLLLLDPYPGTSLNSVYSAKLKISEL